jgi:hypothetical protein
MNIDVKSIKEGIFKITVPEDGIVLDLKNEISKQKINQLVM